MEVASWSCPLGCRLTTNRRRFMANRQRPMAKLMFIKHRLQAKVYMSPLY